MDAKNEGIKGAGSPTSLKGTGALRPGSPKSRRTTMEAPLSETVTKFSGGKPSIKWVMKLLHVLKVVTELPPSEMEKFVPFDVAMQLLDSLVALYKTPEFGSRTVWDHLPREDPSASTSGQPGMAGGGDQGVEPAGSGGGSEGGGTGTGTGSGGPSVILVGDTHGHFHDLLHIWELAGYPSWELGRHFIFNGDFVDRGAWGVEVLLALAAWRLALPRCVVLVRGNHESRFCTMAYGFRAELQAKYPTSPGGAQLYRRCLTIFSLLPLAATVSGNVLVLHGGLFRAPPPKPPPGKVPRRSCRRPSKKSPGGPDWAYADPPDEPAPLELGRLSQLRSASSGGTDPDGMDEKPGAKPGSSSLMAADVLWSDPMKEHGLRLNRKRGIGLNFGPDMTEKFLVSSGISLIVRSHEGPDARNQRPDMQDISLGYAEDHVVPSGKLVTLFSAPDYPMCGQNDDDRLPNKGSYMVLKPPDYSKNTEVVTFSATNRPNHFLYYTDDSSEY